MNSAVSSDAKFDRIWKKVLSTSSLFDPVIDDRVRSIMDEVARHGDKALLKFSEQFDGAKLTARQLAVSPEELDEAAKKVNKVARAAIKEAFANIQSFGKQSKRNAWNGRNSHKAKVGEKYDPFRRVGLYVPGGTAPLASTVLMTVGLAKVAGCKDIRVARGQEFVDRDTASGGKSAAFEEIRV